MRTILFDFGNALSEEGGVDAVFEPVIDDLKTTLGGKKLDLFVMTHEHLDHVQGFFYAKEKLKKSIKARQVWLTGSADPTYYDDHPDAKKELKAAYAAYRAAKVRLNALPEVSFFTSVLMANNDVRTTKKCIDYLRTGLATPQNVHYVDRTTDLSQIQPANSATLTLWAPEENTAEYYGKFKPLAASLRIGDNADFDDLDLGLKEPEDLELPAAAARGRCRCVLQPARRPPFELGVEPAEHRPGVEQHVGRDAHRVEGLAAAVHG